jgi:UPF0755 protein
MNKIYKILVSFIIVFLLLVSFLYINIFTKTNTKQYPITVEIVQGESLYSITNKLYGSKIINNKFIFKNFIQIMNQDTKIKTGEYTFKKPLNVIEIVEKLVNGRYEYTPIVVTIKEGEDYKTISNNIYNNFKNVSNKYTRNDFSMVIKYKEGYLFPETYNFPPFANIEDIFKKIDQEFIDRIKKYNLTTFNELNKVLTIASILEKEVQKPEDMKIVSGIIYNRLERGMPLQMDSTLGYFTGKASLELTTADLQIDSPYNTYKVKGLPSGPIGNPGDVAIDAAINPDKNDYLFFLSDKDGVNHYAKTYAEHLRNRRVYLGK